MIDDSKITKERFGRLILLLIQQPFRYKKKDIAKKLDVSISTIDRDLTALTNIGLDTTYNEKYRYGFIQDKAYDELKNLLHFTTEEQDFLVDAIDAHNQLGESEKTAKRIKRKLKSLYDFRKLGLDILREPNLQMINLLEKAKNQQKQIILKNYHSSNSNSVRDRLVEPLRVSPFDDMVFAYDVESEKISYFRMTRIGGIELLDKSAIFKGSLNLGDADPFYIVSEEKIQVRLEFGVAAYNELILRFPLAKRHIKTYASGDKFEFQCDVNNKFYGVSNFILNMHHDLVIIHEPIELLEHLQEKLKKMQGFFEV
ncbi:MAG: putative DNA-binding transcriptional regulator YafY [Cognaticolwellia sp.]|jgi:predicted DNA-binding transcriptional regulator YafY